MSNGRRVALVVGTRPEAIKMAPVVGALRARGPQMSPLLVSTGQHEEMIAQGLGTFGLVPDVELGVMRPRQSLAQLSSRLFEGLDAAFARHAPDMVLVQGDTTTTLISSLAAYYRRIPVGHVEAGLRTAEKYNPFPEELNRRLTGHVADEHFAPTERARQNLLREGLPAERVHVTGNTVIDALHYVARCLGDDLSLGRALDDWLDPAAQLILVTAHRRESFGPGLRRVCAALRTLARRFPREVQIVFPVHLNPNVREPVHAELDGVPGVRLLPPVDYVDLVRLLRRCRFVLTDSGGIQEEAPAFGKPVLVMRDRTERPEGIEAGCARLTGVSEERIVEEASRLLTSAEAYRSMSAARSPYGDGRAAERIAAIVEARLSAEPVGP